MKESVEIAQLGRSVSVLTLNVWGLPSFISKDKNERILAIATKINESSYDVVCLQEVWSLSDYEIIKSCTKTKFRHEHYFHSGVIGSGLCILSQWPIEEVMFHQWPINGYMHMLHHGDWFGGKGVALCQVNIEGLLVNVYTTHLHAEYNRIYDQYLAHRVIQAFDTALFIRLTSECSHLSILAGDLNSEPTDLCHQLIMCKAALKDCFRLNIDKTCDGTNECAHNSYTKPTLKEKAPCGKRIDYILYKTRPDMQVNVESYCLPLEARIKGTNFSYSDHEAVAVTLKVVPNCENGIDKHESKSIEAMVYERGIDVLDEALMTVRQNAIFYWECFLMFGCILLFVISLFHSLAAFDISIVGRSIYYSVLGYTFSGVAFFLLMATIWQFIEKKAILGCLMRIQGTLNNMEEYR